MNQPLSVIIPALNEAVALPVTLAAAGAPNVELIVVDGGSTDQTMAVARALGAVVLRSPPGRAAQMNAGAVAATHDHLLFLHADTVLPQGYDDEVSRILAEPGVAAGAFRLGIAGRRRAFRWIERAANSRSRYLSLPYGDQALFMPRAMFSAAGMFPPMAAMEDFTLVRRLRESGTIGLAQTSVITSGRRWNQQGIWRTTLRNQLAIGAHLCGVHPARVARILGRAPAAPEVLPAMVESLT